MTTLSCWVKDKTGALTWLHTITVGIFDLMQQTGKCITLLKLFSAMTLYTDRYLNVLSRGNSLLADDWLFHDSAILNRPVVSNYVPNFTISFHQLILLNQVLCMCLVHLILAEIRISVQIWFLAIYTNIICFQICSSDLLLVHSQHSNLWSQRNVTQKRPNEGEGNWKGICWPALSSCELLWASMSEGMPHSTILWVIKVTWVDVSVRETAWKGS